MHQDTELIEEMPQGRALSDENWRIQTKLGNDLYRKECYTAATPYYLKAVEEAQRHFEEACRVTAQTDCVPMLVVSCGNLAENLLLDGKPSKAVQTAATAVETLCRAVSNPELPMDVRKACSCHLKPALAGLTDLNGRAEGNRFAVSAIIATAQKAVVDFIDESQTKQ